MSPEGKYSIDSFKRFKPDTKVGFEASEGVADLASLF